MNPFETLAMVELTDVPPWPYSLSGFTLFLAGLYHPYIATMVLNWEYLPEYFDPELDPETHPERWYDA